MKMKKIVLILAILIPTLVSAQRIEVYLYNSYKYISLYAYGLPREIVKTNDEMRASMSNGNGTGVTRRHHTSKGYDQAITSEGYNNNLKLSFAFRIAPYNVDRDGKHIAEGVTDYGISWTAASGRTDDRTAIASPTTGCAAYRGPQGTDNPGDWRLPTQRELQVMFTVIEQSYSYLESGEVKGSITDGAYWTSTEFDSGYNEAEGKLPYIDGADHIWAVRSTTGETFHTTNYEVFFARCVRDIYETIND